MSRAAIVLCGGFSRRMGRDKAALTFGNESMLDRVVRIVSEIADEVLVVTREGQSVTANARVVHDSAEGLGPLAGLAAGLQAMESEQGFLTACDAPLLRSEFLTRLFELSAGYDVALPRIDSHYMTTCAVYAKKLAPLAHGLVEQERLRLMYLVDAAGEGRTRIVEEREIRESDPELQSFLNCNTPDAYREALRVAGLD